MEKHRDKIEKYGVMLEKMGLTPVASRVFVHLLFGGADGVGFDELVAYFKVSKSAVSNALKTLTDSGMVSFKTIGGQRKRFFYVNMKALFNEKTMTEKYVQFLTILEDIRKARNKDDKFAQDLEDIAILYKMMLVEFPIILERWKKTIEFRNRPPE